jgi:hypothetical protein
MLAVAPLPAMTIIMSPIKPEHHCHWPRAPATAKGPGHMLCGALGWLHEPMFGSNCLRHAWGMYAYMTPRTGYGLTSTLTMRV